MAYNPYNAVKKISELKGSYHTAKEKGQDPTQYAQEAVQYYNELRKNGKGDVADKLAGVDYTGSLEILKGYNAPTEYDWYDNLVGQKIEEASKPVRSETVDQILSVYNKNNDLLSGQVSKDANGNYVSGAYADLYGQAAKQMDYIRDMDMTKQPWYENLMAQYQLGGQSAAKGALASGAAGNSGNIDSYAAANANRQQLAYTTAGTQAALDAYAQQLAAWQNAFGGAAGLLDSAAMRNNEALEIGAKYYDTDSMERQNALNRAAELERAKYQAQIDELAEQLGYDRAIYEADRDYDSAKLDFDLAKYQEQLAAAQQAAQTAGQTTAQQTTSGTSTQGNTLADTYTGTEIAEEILAIANDPTVSSSFGVKNWSDFEAKLIENGIPEEEAKKLRSEFEKKYPNTFKVITTAGGTVLPKPVMNPTTGTWQVSRRFNS